MLSVGESIISSEVLRSRIGESSPNEFARYFNGSHNPLVIKSLEQDSQNRFKVFELTETEFGVKLN